ncbi:MAG TPA: hypothetical protein PKO06_07435 [Candidatus Ozemobacteraceae bacterium]|nr:hypothetical protein [Candidatus Ozemobacteraceae bacterium]
MRLSLDNWVQGQFHHERRDHASRRRKVIVLLLLFSLAICLTAYPEPSPATYPAYVASTAFSLNWYVLNFSGSSETRDISTLVDHRGHIDVTRAITLPHGSCTWTLAEPNEPGLYIFSGSDHPASDTIWLYAEFELATDTPLLWWYDADDLVHVWVNGRDLGHKPFPTGVATPALATLFAGRAGKNALLARVDNVVGVLTFFTELRAVTSPATLQTDITALCQELLAPSHLDTLLKVNEINRREPFDQEILNYFESWNQDLPRCPLAKIAAAFRLASQIPSRHQQRRQAHFLRWLIDQSGVQTELDRQLSEGLRRIRISRNVTPNLARRLFARRLYPEGVLATRLLRATGTMPGDLPSLMFRALFSRFQFGLVWETSMEIESLTRLLDPRDRILVQYQAALHDFLTTDVASAAEKLDQICRENPDFEPAFHLRSVSLLQHFPPPPQRSEKAFKEWRQRAQEADLRLYRSLIR